MLCSYKTPWTPHRFIQKHYDLSLREANMLKILEDKDLESVCGGAQLGNSVFLSLDNDPDTHCQLFLQNPNVAMVQEHMMTGNPGGQTTMGGVLKAAAIRGV